MGKIKKVRADAIVAPEPGGDVQINGLTVRDGRVIPEATKSTVPSLSRMIYDTDLFSKAQTFDLSDIDVDEGFVVIENLLVALDDTVVFSSTGTLPSPLVAGQVYYVVEVLGESVWVSATKGGSPIFIIPGGSGTHTATTNTSGEIDLRNQLPANAVIQRVWIERLVPTPEESASASASLSASTSASASASGSPAAVDPLISLGVNTTTDIFDEIPLSEITGIYQTPIRGKVEQKIKVTTASPLILTSSAALPDGTRMAVYVQWKESEDSLKGGTKRSDFEIREVTSDTTLQLTDEIVEVDSTGGAITFTLLPATTFGRGRFTIVDAAFNAHKNNITVAAAGSDKVHNDTSVRMFRKGTSFTFYCNGVDAYNLE